MIDKKPVILNCDGNIYYYDSVGKCARSLRKSVQTITKWIKEPEKYCIDKVRLEYYDENKHKNIKEYM